MWQCPPQYFQHTTLPPSPCISGRQNIGMWVVVSLSWEQKPKFKCQQFRPRSLDVMGQWSMNEILSVSRQDKGAGKCQQYFIVAREKHEWNKFLRLEPQDDLQCHPHSSDYQYKERTVGDRESDPAPREQRDRSRAVVECRTVHCSSCIQFTYSYATV